MRNKTTQEAVNNDGLKNKIVVLVVSLIFTGGVVLLFFLDTSRGWDLFKIYSCAIVNLWVFFIPPAIRNSYLLNQDKSQAEWFKMGIVVGASGIPVHILLAPLFGLKYYFNF